MAFFGVTYSGDYQNLHRTQPANHTLVFESITEERFEELFQSHKLGDSPTAAALQVRPFEAVCARQAASKHGNPATIETYAYTSAPGAGWTGFAQRCEPCCACAS